METLEYFASSTMPPLFEVFEVYAKQDHLSHEKLVRDLMSISTSQLELFDSKSDLSFLVEDTDRELSRRLYCFIDLIGDEIDRLRVKCLTVNTESLPDPYNHQALQGLELDRNNLATVTDFKLYRGGFSKKNEVFVLLPNNNRINSSYWLLQELGRIQERELIKIRLDPLIHLQEQEFNPMQFRMQVYGRGFAWERIKSLQNIEHTQFIPDNVDLGDILRTDLFWIPSGEEIHFTCEEMPKKEMLPFRGSRYFHAIFEKKTGLLKHCDGAIRFYTEDEFDSRISTHLKTNENTRVGKRIKIFQIDVPIEKLSRNVVSHEAFINLVPSFFVWNQDILNYFNNAEN